MQELSAKLYSFPKTEFRSVYKLSLPEISKAGLLSALSSGGFKEFHEKLILLPSLPHGIGVGVGIMAQTNVAGRILRLLSGVEPGLEAQEETRELAKTILSRLSQGLGILGLGVSEPGWMGKISNLKSVAKRLPDGSFELTFAKGFVTNGADAEGFLVVAKGEEIPYGVFYVPRNSEGLELEEFHLDFAPEATHCKIKATNLRVPKHHLFLPDYSKFGPDVHLSEMLSAAVLFCGAIRKIVSDLGCRPECRDWSSTLGQLWDLSGLLFSKCLELSEKKDRNPAYKIEEDHPYGYETVLDISGKLLDSLPFFDRKKEYPDFELFFSFHPARSPVYLKNRIKQTREWRKFGVR
ncbi:acyl-CoA dehydrogenase, central domain protein [Leptospira inadai serovar Lyme str. 10]|uniref:Acyl-CoA dehydrogenase, central domain protein n=2 Tax=Leptospira inadai serovar Lyme TaxID=293084 RepID=V6HJS6_9LEPT|nr:acyl-CoA dehydrogenase [Leptospira inadai]EQA37150.1 acyl-CoA dehydrogenase, central domain protein [Leptospira inadai serovar Lyme str. 10]PNV76657.1 acyl-CoA dehydrogenase [Leptospira inadai serovar Lyme]